MPDSLKDHGCAVTTKNNGEQYLAVLGGTNNSQIVQSSIYLLNLATKKWETYPNIILPLPIGQITGTVALQLDQQGILPFCLYFFNCLAIKYVIIKMKLKCT